MQNLREFLASSGRDTLLDGTLLGLALLAEQLLTTDGLGVRVEAEEHRFVAERVLLLGERP